uniref:Small integral membrane protein 20 n=1 Tax=Leptobrachium leishanense TaxID=445787 RepID=A0A8C5LSL7_9ANUR
MRSARAAFCLLLPGGNHVTGVLWRQQADMGKNTRVVLLFGGFVAAVAAAFYPIYFYPMMHIEEFKKEQAVNRSDVVQEDVQPVGLKVWSDPFARK